MGRRKKFIPNITNDTGVYLEPPKTKKYVGFLFKDRKLLRIEKFKFWGKNRKVKTETLAIAALLISQVFLMGWVIDRMFLYSSLGYRIDALEKSVPRLNDHLKQLNVKDRGSYKDLLFRIKDLENRFEKNLQLESKN